LPHWEIPIFGFLVTSKTTQDTTKTKATLDITDLIERELKNKTI
jgi:hypothetical protein